MKQEIRIRRDAPLRDLGMARLVRRAARAALSAEGVDVPVRIDVRMTDDGEIRRLNREYRDTDRVTDVLSFPMQELVPEAFDPDSQDFDPETGKLLLGDMILNAAQIRRQAEEFGHSRAREAAYLTVHSVLHLLGYDHVDEGEMKKQMRRREEAILRTLGLEKK